MYAQPLHFLPGTLPLSSSIPLSPNTCLNASNTFEQLINCFNGFTFPHDSYTATTYAQAQPEPAERASWTTAVSTLLAIDGEDFTCADALSSLVAPNPLGGLYTYSLFHDDETEEEFCILHETTSVVVNGTAVYAKGWGLVAVPATRSCAQRDLHFAAPHPEWDLETPQQAAALFKSTHARSLLIAGRIRTAFMEPTDCIVSSTSSNWKTDPAHDVEQPFFNASIAIYRAQMKAGCDPLSCAFIQLHGKGATTCASDDMFLSSGLGASAGSVEWYTDSTPRPVKMIQQALLTSAAFPSWTITLPSEDPSCTALMATTNVVGRHLNGVDLSSVCEVGATAKTATGLFVHIEQSAASRSGDVYGNWTRALESAFPPLCA
ncbi:hypothetical protein EXIGLDRAFT_599281 [Exidia glandulosa HHB12029]|uniref:Uncharacterized protein n=1 Tax=Exidia glandulosa HHB12029 TaxID=1314781 RepID=A0A166BVM2_EXIGL|nr:hypothetical protein EXIGLDRAFT_599281 [Exidia glandulosa HHB12029]